MLLLVELVLESSGRILHHTKYVGESPEAASSSSAGIFSGAGQLSSWTPYPSALSYSISSLLICAEVRTDTSNAGSCCCSPSSALCPSSSLLLLLLGSHYCFHKAKKSAAEDPSSMLLVNIKLIPGKYSWQNIMHGTYYLLE